MDGADSRIIPVRQTEQVLLDLIQCARKHLLVVSYAVYRISRIREALLRAADRGVRVRIVLDVADPDEMDGYNPLLPIREPLLSCAEILYWPKEQRPPDAEGRRGTLHVRCVVADSQRISISSANLTEQAFRMNMELGILITGTRFSREVDAVSFSVGAIQRKNYLLGSIVGLTCFVKLQRIPIVCRRSDLQTRAPLEKPAEPGQLPSGMAGAHPGRPRRV